MRRLSIFAVLLLTIGSLCAGEWNGVTISELNGAPETGWNATAIAFVAAADVISPSPTTVAVGATGLILTLAFTENTVAGVDGFSTGFAVTTDGDSTVATYSSGSGTMELVYDLSAPVKAGDVLTLGYTQPGAGVKDAAGNLVATFSGFSVTNDSTVASGPPPEFIQQAVGTDIDSEVTAVFETDVYVGSLIVVCVTHANTSAITGVTDNQGNTYTQRATRSGTGVATDIWTAVNAGFGTTTITVEQVSALTQMAVNISEFIEVATEIPDATNGNSALASSTVTTGSVTPATANNLVIAVGGWVADDYDTGPTNSFTRMTPIGAGLIWQESAYLIQSSATAKSTGWGLSGGINWAASIAVFPGN